MTMSKALLYAAGALALTSGAARATEYAVTIDWARGVSLGAYDSPTTETLDLAADLVPDDRGRGPGGGRASASTSAGAGLTPGPRPRPPAGARRSALGEPGRKRARPILLLCRA
jgi:hypothetical protein